MSDASIKRARRLTSLRVFRTELANLQTRIRQFRERKPLEPVANIFLGHALERLEDAQEYLGYVADRLDKSND